MNDVRSKVIDTFKDLRKMGFIARANFEFCQGDAGYLLTEMAEERVKKGKEIKGCVYWHHQDEESYKKYGTLYLGFGNMESSKLGTIGIPTKKVGEIIVNELRKRDLSVKWDGNPNTRILVGGNHDR
jgi:hypothetical protein